MVDIKKGKYYIFKDINYSMHRGLQSGAIVKILFIDKQTHYVHYIHIKTNMKDIWGIELFQKNLIECKWFDSLLYKVLENIK